MSFYTYDAYYHTYHAYYYTNGYNRCCTNCISYYILIIHTLIQLLRITPTITSTVAPLLHLLYLLLYLLSPLVYLLDQPFVPTILVKMHIIFHDSFPQPYPEWSASKDGEDVHIFCRSPLHTDSYGEGDGPQTHSTPFNWTSNRYKTRATGGLPAANHSAYADICFRTTPSPVRQV